MKSRNSCTPQVAACRASDRESVECRRSTLDRRRRRQAPLLRALGTSGAVPWPNADRVEQRIPRAASAVSCRDDGHASTRSSPWLAESTSCRCTPGSAAAPGTSNVPGGVPARIATATPSANSRGRPPAAAASLPASGRSRVGTPSRRRSRRSGGSIGEDGRDERGIARLMRLDVHPFGQPHAEARDGVSCRPRCPRRLVERVSSALHAAQLRVSAACRAGAARPSRAKTRRVAPLACGWAPTSCPARPDGSIRHGPQGNDTAVGRRHRHPVELHRRQVLEHEVPLPALRRVRRLQPVPRRHRTRERERAQRRRSAGFADSARRSPRAPRPRLCTAAADAQRLGRRRRRSRQSSTRSPGEANDLRAPPAAGPDRSCRSPSFSTHAAPGQHDVGRARERRSSARPGRRAATACRTAARRPSTRRRRCDPAGPGSKT